MKKKHPMVWLKNENQKPKTLAQWCSWLLLLIGCATLGGLALGDEPNAAAPAKPRADKVAQLRQLKQYVQEIVDLRRQGKLPETIAAAEKMLALQREVYGNDSDTLTVSLRFLAEMQAERLDFAAAEKSLKEVLLIRVTKYGPADWRATDARLALRNLETDRQLNPDQRRELSGAKQLNFQVIQLREQGKIGEATEIAAKVVKIQRKYRGEMHLDYATSIGNLAELYQSQAAYAKAEPLHLRSLEITKGAVGEKHPHYALGLNNLAAYYFSQGAYAKVEPLFQQSLAIQKETLGVKHLDYAQSLNNLALLYRSQGAYAKAAPLFQQSLEIRKETLGEAHPEVARSLSGLSLLYRSQGEFAQAERLYQQAIQIRKKTLGERHPDYAASLDGLASVYQDQSAYVKAEPLFRQSVQIRKEAFGEKHPDYATGVSNLAGFYFAQGAYAKAEPLYQLTLEITKEAQGEKHPDYARGLHNLAELYKFQGAYAKAEPLYRQALNILDETIGEIHPDFAKCLNSLAELYQSQGDYVQAEPLFRQALDIAKVTLGEEHPDYAQSLNNLAVFYFSQGAYTKSEPLYQPALRIRKQTLGETHPGYALCLNNLAALYLDIHKPADAWVSASQAQAIILRHRDETAAIQSESRQLALRDANRSGFDVLFAAGLAAKQPGEALYAVWLAEKGAVTVRQTYAREMLQLAENQQSPLQQTAVSLREKMRELAAQSLRIAPEAERKTHFESLRRLSTEIDELQQKLAAGSAEFLRLKRRPTPGELAAQIPTGGALVDFARYAHRITGAEGKPGKWEPRYMAFIVRKDAPVKVVELKDAQPIDEAVEAWHTALANRSNSAAGRTLREKIWLPIERELKGQDGAEIKTVLISPDGLLHKVPWAALPGQPLGTYLLEEYTFATIPVPRLWPEERKKSDQESTPSLLLVGNVDYGAASVLLANDARPASVVEAPRGGEGVWNWRRLNGTTGEVAALHQLFNAAYSGGAVKELQEAEASESTVRELAPRQQFIHLATHGYFAPPELKSILESSPDAPLRGMGDSRPVSGYDPALLSGIVLAGANQPIKSGQDDGILTASEVLDLPLKQTELVTLSACQTGLGKTAGGEGVLGLQRAFQAAGARTVCTSLWNVPDEGTRVLMEEFYRNLWEKKLPRAEALRQAQLKMLTSFDPKTGALRGTVAPLKETIADNTPTKDRVPPYYWAAFMLSGDWR